jgi:hypothetical protein
VFIHECKDFRSGAVLATGFLKLDVARGAGSFCRLDERRRSFLIAGAIIGFSP